MANDRLYIVNKTKENYLLIAKWWAGMYEWTFVNADLLNDFLKESSPFDELEFKRENDDDGWDDNKENFNKEGICTIYKYDDDDMQ